MPTRSRIGAGQPGAADHLGGLLAREVRSAGAPRRGRGCRAGSGPWRAGRSARALPRRGPASERRRRARSGAPAFDPAGLARVEDGEVRVLLGRLDEAGAKARLAEDRLEVLGQEVARDVELARRAGRPRSRRPRARPGTRSGPRAPAPSRSGGCARGRRARACAARPGRAPFRAAVHRPTRAPRRWPFADRSGGTGRSEAGPRGESRSPDRTARRCLRRASAFPAA